MRDHTEPRALAFLRHFFLLASVGEQGVLRYQDTSTGQLVAQHRTRLGSCSVLTSNPASGVALCGHRNGSVTLWSANMGEPLARLLVHRGPVRAACVDGSGRFLVTAGADSQVKVWDLRFFKELHAYFSATPAVALDVSQRGMVALAYGSHVQVWRDCLAAKAAAPYLNHLVGGGACPVSSLRFCPYDDVLAVGHARGITSMLARPRPCTAPWRRALPACVAQARTIEAALRAKALRCGVIFEKVYLGATASRCGRSADDTRRARRAPLARVATARPDRRWRRRAAAPCHGTERIRARRPARAQVPGAGEPNFDSFVANPFESKKQRQEAEVHALLDKLQPGMIQLDGERVGTLVRTPAEVVAQRRSLALDAELAARRGAEEATDGKKKMKGRRRASRVHRRKQLNVIDAKRMAELEKEAIKAKLLGLPPRQTERAASAAGGGAANGKKTKKKRAATAAADAPTGTIVPSALLRFVKK